MSSIRSVATQMRAVLTTVANEAGRESGCVRRQRCFDGARLVQTLVFGWYHNPDASLSELVGVAANRGVVVSAQGLAQRFTAELATCLARVLDAITEQVVVTQPAIIPLLERFRGVYVLDSSTVRLPEELAELYPGCGGQSGGGQAALKLQVRLELGGGGLAGPDLEAGRASDRASALQHASLPPGSLRLADVGYFSVAVLRRIDEEGGYWLTRWQTSTAISDPDGWRWDDIAAMLERRADPTTGLVDTPILLGASAQLPVRLLAFRISEQDAATRRRNLRRRGQRNGYTPTDRALAVASWTLILTNVPPEYVGMEEAVVLLRARWQIELLFKRWKSQGGLSRSRSRQPWRMLCEIYAKLIGLVLAHCLLVIGCWQHHNRSLVKADQLLRTHIIWVALSFDTKTHLVSALEYITSLMRQGCRLNRRKARPSTDQLLLDPSLVDGLT